MVNHTSYVPVLRWKPAEIEALGWLKGKEKAHLMPLIELVPPNFRTKEGEPLPVREALRGIANEIEVNWGFKPFYIDLEHVVAAGIRGSKSDPHILEILAENIRNALPLLSPESKFIPVTGLKRTAGFQAAVASIVDEDRMGAGIRVTLGDVFKKEFSTTLEALPYFPY